MRRSAFFIRVIGIGILFHIYIGVRLIPAAPVGAPLRWLAVAALVASCLLIPLGMAARTIEQQPLSDRLALVGLLVMGFFSTLLVLTFARDIVLLVMHVGARVRGMPVWPEFVAWSALAVPFFALLVTLAGLYGARRRAPVKSVDVPIDNLPAALHGFTTARHVPRHGQP